MGKGFSILYKPANKPTDNTLITILGKPTTQDSWQDNLIRVVVGQMWAQMPNAFSLQVINNEAPLISRLQNIGCLSASLNGSLQNLIGVAPTDTAKAKAEAQGKEPLSLICEFLNQNLLSGLCKAEPFFDKAIQNIKNGVTPIFEFNKDAEDLVRWLYEQAADNIHQALKPIQRTGNYVIWKNAIVTKDAVGLPFNESHYHNLVLVDNSQNDTEYIGAYQEPDDFVGFVVVASNTDSNKYAQAHPQLLADYVNNTLVKNTLQVITA